MYQRANQNLKLLRSPNGLATNSMTNNGLHFEKVSLSRDHQHEVAGSSSGEDEANSKYQRKHIRELRNIQRQTESKSRRIDEFHPSASKLLQVTRLESSVSEEDLLKKFSKFGDIIDVDIIHGAGEFDMQSEKNFVSAIVQFCDISSVVKAINNALVSPVTIQGRHVKLNFGVSQVTNCLWLDGLESLNFTSQSLQINTLKECFSSLDIRIAEIILDKTFNRALIYFDSNSVATKAYRAMKYQGRFQCDFASYPCQNLFKSRVPQDYSWNFNFDLGSDDLHSLSTNSTSFRNFDNSSSNYQDPNNIRHKTIIRNQIILNDLMIGNSSDSNNFQVNKFVSPSHVQQPLANLMCGSPLLKMSESTTSPDLSDVFSEDLISSPVLMSQKYDCLKYPLSVNVSAHSLSSSNSSTNTNNISNNINIHSNIISINNKLNVDTRSCDLENIGSGTDSSTISPSTSFHNSTGSLSGVGKKPSSSTTPIHHYHNFNSNTTIKNCGYGNNSNIIPDKIKLHSPAFSSSSSFSMVSSNHIKRSHTFVDKGDTKKSFLKSENFNSSDDNENTIDKEEEDDDDEEEGDEYDGNIYEVSEDLKKNRSLYRKNLNQHLQHNRQKISQIEKNRTSSHHHRLHHHHHRRHSNYQEQQQQHQQQPQQHNQNQQHQLPISQSNLFNAHFAYNYHSFDKRLKVEPNVIKSLFTILPDDLDPHVSMYDKIKRRTEKSIEKLHSKPHFSSVVGTPSLKHNNYNSFTPESSIRMHKQKKSFPVKTSSVKDQFHPISDDIHDEQYLICKKKKKKKKMKKFDVLSKRNSGSEMNFTSDEKSAQRNYISSVFCETPPITTDEESLEPQHLESGALLLESSSLLYSPKKHHYSTSGLAEGAEAIFGDYLEEILDYNVPTPSTICMSGFCNEIEDLDDEVETQEKVKSESDIHSLDNLSQDKCPLDIDEDHNLKINDSPKIDIIPEQCSLEISMFQNIENDVSSEIVQVINEPYSLHDTNQSESEKIDSNQLSEPGVTHSCNHLMDEVVHSPIKSNSKESTTDLASNLSNQIFNHQPPSAKSPDKLELIGCESSNSFSYQPSNIDFSDSIVENCPKIDTNNIHVDRDPIKQTLRKKNSPRANKLCKQPLAVLLTTASEKLEALEANKLDPYEPNFDDTPLLSLPMEQSQKMKFGNIDFNNSQIEAVHSEAYSSKTTSKSIQRGRKKKSSRGTEENLTKCNQKLNSKTISDNISDVLPHVQSIIDDVARGIFSQSSDLENVPQTEEVNRVKSDFKANLDYADVEKRISDEPSKLETTSQETEAHKTEYSVQSFAISNFKDEVREEEKPKPVATSSEDSIMSAALYSNPPLIQDLFIAMATAAVSSNIDKLDLSKTLEPDLLSNSALMALFCEKNFLANISVALKQNHVENFPNVPTTTSSSLSSASSSSSFTFNTFATNLSGERNLCFDSRPCSTQSNVQCDSRASCEDSEYYNPFYSLEYSSGFASLSSTLTVDGLSIDALHPTIWQGFLSLKNEEILVNLHHINGNISLVESAMALGIASSAAVPNKTGAFLEKSTRISVSSIQENSLFSASPLKIVQRMRLEASQLDAVVKKMLLYNDHCSCVALANGGSLAERWQMNITLTNSYIKYMQEKSAAGIVNILHPNNHQGLYVVHIFPPCQFSSDHLQSLAPRLYTQLTKEHIPHLLVVITTV